MITFAPELAEVVAYVPLDRILLETDAPYATPRPHRGKPNEPVFVSFVANKVAEIKKVSTESVIEQTWENTKTVFGL